jgi:hypothetical protein
MHAVGARSATSLHAVQSAGAASAEESEAVVGARDTVRSRKLKIRALSAAT